MSHGGNEKHCSPLPPCCSPLPPTYFLNKKQILSISYSDMLFFPLKSGVGQLKVSYEGQTDNINRIFNEANAYKLPNKSDMMFDEKRKF